METLHGFFVVGGPDYFDAQKANAQITEKLNTDLLAKVLRR